jgi:hypothetical protein
MCSEPRDFYKYISLSEEAFNYWHIERAAVLHFGRVIFICESREKEQCNNNIIAAMPSRASDSRQTLVAALVLNLVGSVRLVCAL